MTQNDELNAWQKETAGITPLGNKKHEALPESSLQKPKKQPPKSTQTDQPTLTTGKHLSAIDTGDFRDIDAATVRKLKRGRLNIDGKIDLHGMTKNQAQEALEQFIFQQVRKQHKLVLVITGKGGIENPATLKTSLPGWLNDTTLRPYIIAFEQAKPNHGGSGAFYVLLRKKTL